jgi:hypothetical protein
MNPGSGTPPPEPPPPLPQISEPGLGTYLQQFSLWCRRGFAGKLNANAALTGITMQAFNAPEGTAPTVWMLRVNQLGQFMVERVPLGAGKP